HSCVDYRCLHPFPTRRSSDLIAAQHPLAADGAIGEVTRGGAARRGVDHAEICALQRAGRDEAARGEVAGADAGTDEPRGQAVGGDRKSTRLNSSHVKISYTVF